LGLLSGQCSPRLVEAVARLGTLLPFEQVPEQLAFFAGVLLSRETARRLTETAGAHLVAVEAAELTVLEATLPDPPAGPPVQQLSADGAMVPLVGGQWGEVKLLAIGTVTATPDAAGPPQPHTTDLSYVARLADADSFGRLATLETHRRGTTTAAMVAAVADGAVWLQHFVDLHRPDAVRILDFPHAAQHLGGAAQAVWGEGSAAARCWLSGWLTELKHGDPAAVLAAVATLPTTEAADPAAAATVVGQTMEYLAARWAQIQYARFRAQGLPIGSGCVESGHKVVTQARLKGRGMHWAAANINPLLALRCALLNGRWAERWGRLTAQWRAAVRTRRRARWTARRPPPPPPPPPSPPVVRTSPLPTADAEASAPLAPTAAPPRPKTIVNGRPTAAHPWKRHTRLPRSGAPAPAKR
jgi:hypothetical protein